jgi:hypothetical protein
LRELLPCWITLTTCSDAALQHTSASGCEVQGHSNAGQVGSNQSATHWFFCTLLPLLLLPLLVTCCWLHMQLDLWSVADANNHLFKLPTLVDMLQELLGPYGELRLSSAVPTDEQAFFLRHGETEESLKARAGCDDDCLCAWSA